MKTRFLAAYLLIFIMLLGGCSEQSGVSDSSGGKEIVVQTAVPTQSPAPTPDDGIADTSHLYFSAGESFEPTPTPSPSTAPQNSERQQAAGTPTPKPSATPKPSVAPKQVASPVPTNTPVPTEKPAQTAAPTPTNPTETAKPSEPVPTPSPTPEKPTGRTICNTCGADITGQVAAHGDSHLLNGENFSYRVE